MLIRQMQIRQEFHTSPYIQNIENKKQNRSREREREIEREKKDRDRKIVSQRQSLKTDVNQTNVEKTGIQYKSIHSKHKDRKQNRQREREKKIRDRKIVSQI